jgi:hypothetical protein
MVRQQARNVLYKIPIMVLTFLSPLYAIFSKASRSV